ncbi:TIGR03862 family flavoprotein [Massilia sp. TS11]|uniref:TIGR03862 family flavoprotein n=1 Tax=Massilia sp. TS11 TaxID=2908003 RepID=UPI001EDC5E82|nr:TIGR03862 family flavoprotein [Massilia sp. TS11]MCG2584661.1 TIGR03862 family flavoprotein [Massilia sp. TS11]
MSVPARIAVIGGGPAGLMAAEVLAEAGLAVDVYDAMPSVGRKFLLAGKGGMNITHAEPLDQFVKRYGTQAEQVGAWLHGFGPQALREWIHELGIDTFVGSSGRVFPTEMKAAPLLRAWLRRLRGQGVQFHQRHRWSGWAADGSLAFETPEGAICVRPAATVLALGGASWARLGSDGRWLPVLSARGIPTEPLKPANCGFDVDWSAHFSTRYAGEPLITVALTAAQPDGSERSQRGQFVITAGGVEGSLIYAFSATLREQILIDGQARIWLDLLPVHSEQRVLDAVSAGRGGKSMSSHLQSKLGLKGVKGGLLRECLSREAYFDPVRLAQGIKRLPVILKRARPIDEAISSAGGIRFEALDAGLMLRALPGVFVAGEMIDWEAPTGGYLLTACFASGRKAGAAAAAWVQSLT